MHVGEKMIGKVRVAILVLLCLWVSMLHGRLLILLFYNAYERSKPAPEWILASSFCLRRSGEEYAGSLSRLFERICQKAYNKKDKFDWLLTLHKYLHSAYDSRLFLQKR